MSALFSLASGTLEFERLGRVTRIWLNRPDKHNAINRVMLEGLDAGLRHFAGDEPTRVIVIAGRGPSFCAGFDVDRGEHGFQPAQDPVSDAVDLERRLTRFFSVWDSPKPVIVAAHGHCLAAATILASFADLTLVAKDARIGYSTIPLGGGYLEPLWVHLVGPKRAKQIGLIPGQVITGTQAAEWGWANEAVEPDRLMDEALDIATRMSRMPADLLRLRKHAINRMVELTGFREGAMMGAQTDALLHQSPGVKKLRAAISAHGLKEAIRQFQAGELDV